MDSPVKPSRAALLNLSKTWACSSAGAAHAHADVLTRMRARYDIRLERLRNRAAGIEASRLDEKPISQFQELQQAIITFERGEVQ